jgi:hypothetical protein
MPNLTIKALQVESAAKHYSELVGGFMANILEEYNLRFSGEKMLPCLFY